jgi:preprotein translocase subunit Sec61beta
MTMATTLAVLAASVAAAGLLVWLERRPAEPGRIRLLPTTPLIFLSLVVAVIMLVHIVNLMGGHTGRH